MLVNRLTIRLEEQNVDQGQQSLPKWPEPVLIWLYYFIVVLKQEVDSLFQDTVNLCQQKLTGVSFYC